MATVHQHCVVFTEFIQDLGPCKLDFQLVWEHSGGIQDFPKEGGGGVVGRTLELQNQWSIA